MPDYLGRDQFVYFAACAPSGPLKIGVSTNPLRRINSLSFKGRKLHLLAIAPGGWADEQSTMAYFRASRIYGEWFSFTPEINSCIATIQETGQLPVYLRGSLQTKMAFYKPKSPAQKERERQQMRQRKIDHGLWIERLVLYNEISDGVEIFRTLLVRQGVALYGGKKILSSTKGE